MGVKLFWCSFNTFLTLLKCHLLKKHSLGTQSLASRASKIQDNIDFPDVTNTR